METDPLPAYLCQIIMSDVIKSFDCIYKKCASLS